MGLVQDNLRKNRSPVRGTKGRQASGQVSDLARHLVTSAPLTRDLSFRPFKPDSRLKHEVCNAVPVLRRAMWERRRA